MASKITGKIIDTFCSFYEQTYFSIRQSMNDKIVEIFDKVIKENN